jgi:hypothetical protein
VDKDAGGASSAYDEMKVRQMAQAIRDIIGENR